MEKPPSPAFRPHRLSGWGSGRNALALVALLIATPAYAIYNLGTFWRALTSGSSGGSSPPKLITKNIYGSPGGTATISFSGLPYSSLEIRFRDRHTNQIVATSSLTSGGVIHLPDAGVYTTELRDTVGAAHLVSYGQATISYVAAGWIPKQSITPPAMGYYRVWPAVNMAIGDYDGDGDADLAIAEGDDGSGASVSPGIRLYKYDTGTQQFTLDQTLVTSSPFIYGFQFADVNNDSSLDLVFNRWDGANSTQLCTLTNNGTGTFLGSPVCLTNSGTPGAQHRAYDLAVADLDRDGYLDVVTVGGVYSGTAWTNEEVVIWKGGPTGFTQFATLNGPGGNALATLRIGDMDDDGRLDIVTLEFPSATGVLTVFPQAADGSFSSATAFTSAAANEDEFEVGYLSGGVKLDAVAVNGGNASGTYFKASSSSNAFTTSVVPNSTEMFGGSVSIYDVAQTGTPNVYFSAKNRIIYNNKTGLYFRTAANLTSTTTVDATNTIIGGNTLSFWQYGYSDFVDVDHDGTLDVLNYAPYVPVLEYIQGSSGGHPSKLAFTQNPGASVLLGEVFGTQPIVQVQDIGGNPMGSGTQTITLAAFLDSGCAATPAPGTLASSGTGLSVSATAGSASFTGVSYSSSTKPIYLRASASGLASACYGPINLVGFFASGTGSNSGATTLAINAPTGISAGQMLFAVLSTRTAGTTVTGIPAGWTAIDSRASSSNLMQAAFWKLATASEPASYTFTLSASVKAVGAVLAYVGINSTSPFELASGQANAASTAIVAPSLSPTQASSILLGFFGTAYGTGVSSAPAGFTSRASGTSSGGSPSTNVGVMAADSVLTASGPTGTPTATGGTSAENIGQVIVLKLR